jgi:hypothetical protein
MHTVTVSSMNLDPASKGRMKCQLNLDGESYQLELWYAQHYATPEWLGQSIFDSLDGSEHESIEGLADDVVKRIKAHEDGFMMRDVIIVSGAVHDGSFKHVFELYNI